MIWADRMAKKFKERNLPLEWVDDMKTPSGRIHVGSLRGVMVHDLMYKVLVENGVNASFSYVFNDMDPMDAIPSYLDQKKWSAYAGKSLFQVPSPVEGFESFAKYYAQEFIDVFQSLNCKPQIIWSHELYQSGKMDGVIKTFLDNADTVRRIYKEVAKAERKPDWIPFNPICEKCGNIGTTNAFKWDGEFVHYRCEPNMVGWAKGCGHEGKVSPYGGTGKLPWKLDWPAHWKVIGITIESSGKDHMSSGGSYDMATHFCRDILGTEPPDALGGYEWFTIGGRKMSSSKGIGTSAKEVTGILPPEVFRFFMVRTPITTHLDFNPYGDTIPNLFDDYDRCMTAYYDKKEGKLKEGKQGEVAADFARMIELSVVRPFPEKRLFLPRFRTVANILKTKGDPAAMFEKQLGRALEEPEKTVLAERIAFAKTYLEKYASAPAGTETASPVAIGDDQKKFMSALADRLEKLAAQDRESVQNAVFDTMKQMELKPKNVFSAFYHTLTGKQYGPKAADLILEQGVTEVIKKLRSV